MGRRRGGERVLGPYFDRSSGRWSVIYVPAGGTIKHDGLATRFATEVEAKERVREARHLIRDEAASIETVIMAYLDYQRAKHNKPVSVKTTEKRLRMFFDTDVRELPAPRFSQAHGQRAYDALMARTKAVASHRNALVEARSMCRWAAKRGYMTRNPLAAVEGVGVKKRGNHQPTHDEARKMLDAALVMGHARDERGTYVALLMLTGCRPSEVYHRLVRDVDEGGARLVLPESKTQNGVGSVEIPEVVRPLLVAQTSGKLPLARLFKCEGNAWPNDSVRAVCEWAGVPRVCAQTLRGMHASEARRQGTTGEVVASSLGHGSPTVTKRHYITGEAERAAKQGQVLAMLGLGMKSGESLPGAGKGAK